jgi:hypothetical protein
METPIDFFPQVTKSGKTCDGNDPCGSIKDGKFLEYLSDYQFLKNDSAPWS